MANEKEFASLGGSMAVPEQAFFSFTRPPAALNMDIAHDFPQANKNHRGDVLALRQPMFVSLLVIRGDGSIIDTYKKDLLHTAGTAASKIAMQARKCFCHTATIII